MTDAPNAAQAAQFLNDLTQSLSDNRIFIGFMILSLAGAALGAYAGAQAFLIAQKSRSADDKLVAVNIAIASLVTLLGRLVTFKKDLLRAAQQDDDPTLAEMWPELRFALDFDKHSLFVQTGAPLEAMQLIQMLDSNLSDLVHMGQQRNTLIKQLMHLHDAGLVQGSGTAQESGRKLYAHYNAKIAALADESLLFADKSIQLVRRAAQAQLPRPYHRRIADVALAPQATAAMPQNNTPMPQNNTAMPQNNTALPQGNQAMPQDKPAGTPPVQEAGEEP